MVTTGYHHPWWQIAKFIDKCTLENREVEIDDCSLSILWIFYEQVHLDYLEAGADIIITASYQVSNHIPMNLCLMIITQSILREI